MFCFLGWHTWSLWKELGSGPLVRDGKTIGRFLTQVRHCEACGYQELDEQRTTVNRP